ncbi:two-component system response regulator [Duganella sp. Leaf126]|uniref:response regulator n=1 Tax=Duganella sp. Leaf126 TaxID=1736266 RepID=UPI0006F96469|nr:response regulator [Duganella sp. Leaf126]KQQ47441.1 two-component system response regulator [Duganella sp. Leaf126]
MPENAPLLPLLLLVDDEASNLQLLRHILQDHYRLLYAKDGPRALALAQQELPQLVLLDVMMPEMTGYQVCRLLKRDPVTHDIPVIFVTALSDAADEVVGFEAGAVDYITKPVSPPIVRARVRTHLALARARERQRTSEGIVERLGLHVAQTDKDIEHARDHAAGLHVIRTSQYAHILGLALGMDQQALDDLLGVAYLLALTHHEKWDGSGSPHGLRAEAIPLGQRIVAIAHGFDTLTSARPGRQAWSVEQAVAYLQQQRGLHFEPRLVDLFIEQMPALLEIKQRWAEHT